MSIFSRKIDVTVFILQIFRTTGGKCSEQFPVSCFLRGVFSFERSLVQLYKTTKTLSHLGLKFERRLTVVDVRFKN